MTDRIIKNRKKALYKQFQIDVYEQQCKLARASRDNARDRKKIYKKGSTGIWGNIKQLYHRYCGLLVGVVSVKA